MIKNFPEIKLNVIEDSKKEDNSIYVCLLLTLIFMLVISYLITKLAFAVINL
jgi:hypothetical protein